MRDEKPPSLRGALRRMNGVAFLFSTTGALFLLLPVYLQQIGNTPAQIGFVVGLMRVSMLVARPVAGRLLDRFGRRPVITWGGVVAGIAILSLFLFPQVGWTFLTFRVIQGAATALVDSGLGTVVADLAPAAVRTRVFALYTVWLTLPGGIMPAVGEAVARRAGYLPLFGAAAVVLAAALITFRRLPETLPERSEHAPTSWSLGRTAPPVLVGGMMVGFVFGVSSVFVPVAPIAEAPGRIGAFFFAYFVGLFGMRLANGMGLAWLARPAILARHTPSWRSGSPRSRWATPRCSWSWWGWRAAWATGRSCRSFTRCCCSAFPGSGEAGPSRPWPPPSTRA